MCNIAGAEEITTTLQKTYGEALEKLLPGANILVRHLHASYTDVELIIRDDGNRTAADLRLVQMPGCCGVVVSTGLFVRHDIRSKKLGDLMHQLRDHAVVLLGYGKVTATVICGNKVEEHLLSKYGFTPTQEFINPKTGNPIRLWEKNLTKERPTTAA
jgi:hypothetical protein